MVDYGLKIFDASGSITLDVADKISRLRYSNEVAAGVSSNTTLSDIDGLSSVEISVAIENTVAGSKCSHLFTRSGTIVTWTSQDGVTYNPADSLLFLFLYT
uniref:Uncharacterized protein n=1 Tax=viral metagenome TaxID=1070528 RepID=A0A6M3LBL6_9ZZZZ